MSDISREESQARKRKREGEMDPSPRAGRSWKFFFCSQRIDRLSDLFRNSSRATLDETGLIVKVKKPVKEGPSLCDCLLSRAVEALVEGRESVESSLLSTSILLLLLPFSSQFLLFELYRAWKDTLIVSSPPSPSQFQSKVKAKLTFSLFVRSCLFSLCPLPLFQTNPELFFLPFLPSSKT